MQYLSRFHRFLYSFTYVLFGTQLSSLALSPADIQAQQPVVTQCAAQQPNFLVVGGGGSPSNNEIALEKNVLYFQRTLRAFGYEPATASIFFANGNDGQTTVRYRDEQGLERYKAPEIPSLDGAATLANLQSWMQQAARQNINEPIFFYFTGHGGRNEENLENNSIGLWNKQSLSVQELATMLDQLPSQKPFVAMMAQCYSGSFTNLIYEGGNPKGRVALQSRCGFMATVKERPSVGCTPAVNEADYRDYSSSFFAGLSGRSRIGEAVPSADYNKDGQVSYAEAHAFAKVDDQSTDRPISTSEAWLQSHASPQDVEAILRTPLVQLQQIARPERRYVVDSLAKMFRLNPAQSFKANVETLSQTKENREIQEAYLSRLQMELINIGTEKKIYNSQNQQDIAILERLNRCEGGSWRSP